MNKINIYALILLGFTYFNTNAIDLVNGTGSHVDVMFFGSGKIIDERTQTLIPGDFVYLHEDLFDNPNVAKVKLRWSRRGIPSGRSLTETIVDIPAELLSQKYILLVSKEPGHTPLTHKFKTKVVNPKNLSSELRTKVEAKLTKDIESSYSPEEIAAFEKTSEIAAKHPKLTDVEAAALGDLAQYMN